MRQTRWKRTRLWREDVDEQARPDQFVCDRMRCVPRHHAFTLFEVILALSLITILFSAVIIGTGLYAQYRTRSLEGIRYAKVISGTLADLRFDLRACYEGDLVLANISDDPMNLPTEPSPTSGIRDETRIDEQVLLLPSDVLSQPIHFVGRSNAMLFQRHGDSARFAELNKRYSTQDSQVLWLAPGVRSIRIPVSTSQDRVDQRVFQSDSSQTGLKRLVVSAMTNNLSSFERAIQPRNGNKDNWWDNRDISSVEFRYFDGSNWLSEWDSHLRAGAIPAAVEVTLASEGGDQPAQFSDYERARVPSESMRFVIRMPASSVGNAVASSPLQPDILNRQFSFVEEGRRDE